MPFYQDLSTDDVRLRAHQAEEHLKACDLCPRNCGVNRRDGEIGFCRAGEHLRISSIFPHHGEEPVLSGTRGSGTVFLSHCTMRCAFCQNHQISHGGHGEVFTPGQLAEEMLVLQERGCHNINFVTPTHFVPQIIRSLSLAIPKGLRIPVVYNTSGYESLGTLKLLDGLVDIYLPDIKYADNRFGKELSNCPTYVKNNRAALQEMWQQVGPLVLDSDGIALQGLIVRHLVLPDGKAGSREGLRWIAEALSEEVAVSLMAQYSPVHRAGEVPGMNRRLHRDEYIDAVSALDEAGLSEGWIQDWQGMDGSYLIDFVRRKRERLR